MPHQGLCDAPGHCRYHLTEACRQSNTAGQVHEEEPHSWRHCACTRVRNMIEQTKQRIRGMLALTRGSVAPRERAEPFHCNGQDHPRHGLCDASKIRGQDHLRRGLCDAQNAAETMREHWPPIQRRWSKYMKQSLAHLRLHARKKLD